MMKKDYYKILFILIGVVLAFSFKHGVTKKGHDKTGSPLSSGRCIDCHSAGKYNVSLDMKVFDGDTVVGNYIPGHRYKLKFRIKHTGNPSKYGFQVTALNKENKGVGKFENLPSGFIIRKLKEVDYIDHSNPANVEFLNVDWVAPETHIGDVTVYVGGIAANGNGSTSGDGASVNSFVITDGTSGLVNPHAESDIDLFVLNNSLSNDFIHLQQLKYSIFDYRIIARDGKIIKKSRVDNQGAFSYYVDTSRLTSGLYFIQLVAKGLISTKSFVVARK